MASAIDHRSNAPLLTDSDPPPATVVNPQGRSPFLLIGDHAGNVIPSRLGDLGLPPAERARHIGWDIGVAGVGLRLAAALDATFIRQTYSRLVIDCNRRPDAPDAMPATSDKTIVPGNAALSAADRAARIAAIFDPYHAAIAAEIARRQAAGTPPIVIALHSFTPALTATGIARPWHIGVLHDAGDDAFARALIADLQGDATLTVGDNEPYRMDTIDYSVPRHCYPAGLAYAELEIRQDLIGDAAGQQRWADLLAAILPRVASSLNPDPARS